MTSSLISLVRSSNQLENSLVSIERINDYSSKPTEVNKHKSIFVKFVKLHYSLPKM